MAFRVWLLSLSVQFSEFVLIVGTSLPVMAECGSVVWAPTLHFIYPVIHQCVPGSFSLWLL